MIIGSAELEVRGKTDKFEQDVTGAAKTTAVAAAKAFAAGAVAAKGIDFFRSSLDAARESQKVAAQTEAVIKSTGGSAHVTAKQIDELAGSISKKTGIDDEAIAAGENLLLTFTNVRNEAGAGNDVFNQATATLVDLAAAMGTDVKGGAVQLGKALNDPITGISALTRVGVTFTEQQKEQIKTLVESGRTLDAQKIILAELNKEFGGSAAAQATSADRLKVSLGNLQEGVGNALIPVLDTLSRTLIPIVDAFSNLPSGVQSTIVVVGGLVVALGPLLTVVSNVRTAMAGLGLVMGAGGVAAGAAEGAAAIGVGEAAAGGGLLAALAPLAAPAGVLALAVGGALAFKKAWHDIHSQAQAEISGIKDITGINPDELADFRLKLEKIESAGGNVREVFRKIATDSPEAAKAIIKAMDDAGRNTLDFQTILAHVDETFRNFSASTRDRFIAIGENFADAIDLGLRKGLPSMTGMDILIDGIEAKIKRKSGISSPSTLFEEIGEQLVAGLELGLNSSADDLALAGENLMKKLSDEISAEAQTIRGQLAGLLDIGGLVHPEPGQLGAGRSLTGAELLTEIQNRASATQSIRDDITALSQAGIDPELLAQAAGSDEKAFNLRQSLKDAVAGGLVAQINQAFRDTRAGIAGVGGAVTIQDTVASQAVSQALALIPGASPEVRQFIVQVLGTTPRVSDPQELAAFFHQLEVLSGVG